MISPPQPQGHYFSVMSISQLTLRRTTPCGGDEGLGLCGHHVGDQGNPMSKWQELKAERNRQSVARLTRALPEIFPSVVSVARARPPVRAADAAARDRSYWRAHPLRADRLARALAAESGAPDGWTWRLGDKPQKRIAGDVPHAAGALSRSALIRAVPAFAASAGSRFIASAGMSICGTAARTKTPPGTAPA